MFFEKIWALKEKKSPKNAKNGEMFFFSARVKSAENLMKNAKIVFFYFENIDFLGSNWRKIARNRKIQYKTSCNLPIDALQVLESQYFQNQKFTIFALFIKFSADFTRANSHNMIYSEILSQ